MARLVGSSLASSAPTGAGSLCNFFLFGIQIFGLHAVFIMKGECFKFIFVFFPVTTPFHPLICRGAAMLVGISRMLGLSQRILMKSVGDF